MRRVYRLVRGLIWLVLAAAAGLSLYALSRARPQDMPWTPLDLAQPVGLFTGRKLAALTQDYPGCRAALDRAGIAYVALGPRGAGQCAHGDAVRLRPNAGAIALSPGDVAPSCPVAAALKLWEWHVVETAAQRIYGQGVRQIETLGSFNCRRMYGRSAGRFSEHATADAIDIAGFVLTDGRRVRVVGDWSGTDRDALFLRAVRDGACDLFATVLSPDYNAAHADHFHLDQAERGAMGGRICR
ncbi:extensin family protein [Sphingobium algorifonticola]|uniref:Extensin family protein n=1 Tax=Sphingobium algorifonticola TaxID=2008318 RepID=A0A437JA52_9SPHN|nr:extensin family protein [Sphingobium algorifonticola]RVT42386.1 extensin family protein [Sphingobium algorifonticola]